jgi:hypothetical protein
VRFENEPKNARKTAPERGNRKRKGPGAHLGAIIANSDGNTDLSPDTSATTSSSLRSSKRFARTPAESMAAFSCQDLVLSDLASPSARGHSRSEFSAEQQLSEAAFFTFADALGAVL